jgi:hypothetical protein
MRNGLTTGLGIILWLRCYWPDGFEGGPVPAALVAVTVKV